MQADTSSGWMEIRASNGRLLFKFNPLKNLIELKANGVLHLVDLDDQTVSERPAAPGSAAVACKMWPERPIKLAR